MAVTPSAMIALGTKASEFTLPDSLSGKSVSLKIAAGKSATVIMFICNHCPFVKHIQNKLVDVAKEYQSDDIGFIAISANDAREYPSDSPEKMKIEAERYHYPFPYLYDESQRVAKAYNATCTPDFFVFDKNMACVYRGRFDDSTPGNNQPITGKDLTDALDAILAGKLISPHQHPSMGCNIKWKQS